ncbi:MAG: hypothetical protein LBE31_00565 [Deltaproteobacteria bacterium]|nr:hypothetical protein [Deltaproteobacteria bacterium]
MNIFLILTALALTELGILSLMVAIAYWTKAGSNMTALIGLALVAYGSITLIRTIRRIKNKNSRKARL